ncbi:MULTISPECIES: curli assembly protein CsgF [Shewanella]|jgi:curli production assembly/transport component CsgF|uniref:Curli production assembly/transport component CsgF n=2 Tax=Shewanella baltica TaxID=62322 RepID=A9L3G4_SHEB9|nr:MULTISPECIES: curli assembly protein CsgF [Shewanella]ABN62813.1 curli production assembly/transport component CsgF, putative [Shewanella baltica OS155]ABS07156.1 curli production assembly/transport component CsgF, putative [Shewanella baltica OS185]ABX48213.1 curli production assembly/transport component CsgF, putative [Shewanella baltica OS195]ACK45540.1 curli production assembly/transport component CsgF, putative [Shewanella baltica OS223]ADT93242.1 Curli production assembly/transport co
MTYRTLLALVTLCVASSGQATELIYTPVNPSFGGNPQNGAFLLNKAQAQNDNKSNSTEKDFVTRFKESLERNIINSITRGVADGEITDGVYDTGDFRIEVASTGNGVMLTITNTETGEITVIEMPTFGGIN